MHRFLPLILILFVSGCAAAGTSALTAEMLRADKEEIEYIRSHDLKPYIQVAIIHENVVAHVSSELNNLSHVFLQGEEQRVPRNRTRRLR